MSSRNTNICLTAQKEKSYLALRRYELEAYSAVVTALRAEGELTEEKMTALSHLQKVLGISVGRHRAEVRRAANDDRLENIATVVNGVSFEADWHKEGRRLFHPLKRPTPVTAYTKIADEIAAELVQENARLPKSRINSDSKMRNILPAVNPSCNIEEMDYILPPKRRRLYSANCSSTRTISTSTDDLDKLLLERKSFRESRTQQTKSHSKDNDNNDSYVYLPGGTVVRLESAESADTVSLESACKALAGSSQENSNQRNAPKRRTKKSSSDHNEESAYIIKEIYRPQDVQAYRQQQALRQKQQIKQLQQAERSLKQASTGVAGSRQQRRSPQPKRALLEQEEKNRSKQFVESKPKLAAALQKAPPPTKLEKHPDHSSKKSFMTIQHTPVPPEHLYAAGISGNGQPRSKQYARRHGSSWATKHNVANGSRNKRRIQRSPLLATQKKVSPHLQSYQKSIQHSSSSKLLAQKPSSSSVPDNRTKIESSTFLSSDVHSPVISPQRIFRPTLHIGGTQLAKKDQVSEKLDYSLHHHSSPSKLSSSMSSPEESGLAPVSAIVSRVSSPAFSDTKVVMSANPKPSPQELPIRRKMISAYPKTVHHRPSQVQAQFPKFENSNISRTTPDNMEGQNASSLNEASNEVIHVNTMPHSTQSVSLSNLVSNTEECQEKGDQGPSSSESTKVTNTSLSNVTLAASGLCALAAAPVINDVSKEKPAIVKPASATVHLSSANIIKVTPRSLSSTKGIPIVTQLSGSRITKTITSSGSGKPNIIVVRRPTGKSLKSTPAKFLEIGSKGREAQVPITAVKSLETVSSPVSGTAAIIKPVTTKLVSIPTNVRTLPSKDGSLHRNVRKVISKAKMQQLILKPPLPVGLASATSQPIESGTQKPESSTISLPRSLLPGISVDSSVSEQEPLKVLLETVTGNPQALMQASSTMKALIQKNLKTSEIRPKTFTHTVPSHRANSPPIYASKQLLQKQKQVTLVSTLAGVKSQPHTIQAKKTNERVQGKIADSASAFIKLD